ncbi:MAG: NHLP leader peptide family RiPP precursor [Holophaga sp.]|nr:NHLP leader peptide family RiPP precursor [Holophaga sp.]
MNGTLLLDSSDRVIAKAWADEGFKAALMADPRAALESQGIEVPEGVTLNVLENSEKVFHLVLPRVPEMALAGEALEGSGEAGPCGGGCGGGCRCGGGCGCGGGGGCLCLCW